MHLVNPPAPAQTKLRAVTGTQQSDAEYCSTQGSFAELCVVLEYVRWPLITYIFQTHQFVHGMVAVRCTAEMMYSVFHYSVSSHSSRRELYQPNPITPGYNDAMEDCKIALKAETRKKKPCSNFLPDLQGELLTPVKGPKKWSKLYSTWFKKSACQV
jgi:hypothetical protein